MNKFPSAGSFFGVRPSQSQKLNSGSWQGPRYLSHHCSFLGCPLAAHREREAESELEPALSKWDRASQVCVNCRVQFKFDTSILILKASTHLFGLELDALENDIFLV